MEETENKEVLTIGWENILNIWLCSENLTPLSRQHCVHTLCSDRGWCSRLESLSEASLSVLDLYGGNEEMPKTYTRVILFYYKYLITKILNMSPTNRFK